MQLIKTREFVFLSNLEFKIKFYRNLVFVRGKIQAFWRGEDDREEWGWGR